jgi:transcriptional regulator with XRE-family HTH domain
MWKWGCVMIDLTIGQRLMAIRKYRGLSQTELAQAINATKATIAHYEHGRAAISTQRLERLATALHCRVPDLLAPASAPLPRARFRGGADATSLIDVLTLPRYGPAE